jgi:hypothetical protein
MRVNGVRICCHRDKHKRAVSVEQARHYKGYPDRVTYILWFCGKCRQVTGQVLGGWFDLLELQGWEVKGATEDIPEEPEEPEPEGTPAHLMPEIDPEAEPDRFLPASSSDDYDVPAAEHGLPVPGAQSGREENDDWIFASAEPSELPEPGSPGRANAPEVAVLDRYARQWEGEHARRGRHHAPPR